MYTIAGSAPWTEHYATVSEQVFMGITMTLLGVSIVLLILSLISVTVWLISKLINRFSSRSPQQGKPLQAGKKADDGQGTAPAAVAHSPVPAAEAAPDDQALIAVLSAALAAFAQTRPPQSSAGFIIRRIRRVS